MLNLRYLKNVTVLLYFYLYKIIQLNLSYITTVIFLIIDRKKLISKRIFLNEIYFMKY